MIVYFVECEERVYDNNRNILSCEHSHCENAYTNESKAIQQVTKMTDDIMNDLLNCGVPAHTISRETNANGDYAIVHNGKNETYEYFVSIVNIDED